MSRAPLSRLVIALAAAVLAAHVVTNAFSPYEIHRDALLYFAMGRHLRLWAMDFPPLIALIGIAERGLLGDSLVALRLVPALASGTIVLLAGVIARELGGDRYAQGLAALCVALSPLFLRAGVLFQPVVLDQLWWTLGLLALVRIGRRGGVDAATRDWLLLGLACGLGLLTKFSILFFGFAVLIGILLSPQRRALATRWPWIAAILALTLGAPSIVGQIRLGFPVVGQLRDLQSVQLGRVTYGAFLGEQVLENGPVVLLAAAGLLDLLLARRNRRFRAVGWACAGAFIELLLLHGKPYYLGPVYPTLFAAGAVALERGARGWAERERRAAAGAARWAAVGIAVVYGAVALPLGLPFLPPAPMAAYAARLGVTQAVTTNVGTVLQLPQDYADMLGWKEKAEAVARVYRALPTADRARVVIIGNNYGEAGAVDFYGPRYGLPPAISPAGSYWFFGPGDRRGDVAIVLGASEAGLRPFFRSITLAARVDLPWVVPEERDMPIWLCRDPYRPLQEVWPELRGRN